MPVSADHSPVCFFDQGRFGRLLPALPPFAADTTLIRDALAEIGAPDGPMDAKDDLSDPVTLITDPAKSTANPDNPQLTAGFTFLGQFLDHDMTFDPTSSLARQQDPEAVRNFRIPALDLDNVYGGGPGASPHLYDSSIDGGRTTMLTEEIPGSAAVSVANVARFDVPRNSQRTALLGDPRNDENLIVSQFQLALLRFHNRVVDDVKAEFGTGFTANEIFTEAPPTPPSSSSPSSSTHRRQTPTIHLICGAASGLPADSSPGRRSSTSVTEGPVKTRGSTPSCRRSCSI